MPTVGTEGKWPREGIVELCSSDRSIANVWVKGSSGLHPSLRMMAAITPANATSAAKSGGNTGNGTLGAVTVAANTPGGVYQLRVTVAATNAGTFELRNAKGQLVGTGTVAVAFSGGGLGFTLADGTTDFIVGDGFDITVPTTLWTKYDDSLSDGTQSAQGLALDNIDATGSGNVLAAIIVRDAVVLDRFVTAATSAHKAAGITDLLANDFVFLK